MGLDRGLRGETCLQDQGVSHDGGLCASRERGVSYPGPGRRSGTYSIGAAASQCQYMLRGSMLLHFLLVIDFEREGERKREGRERNIDLLFLSVMLSLTHWLVPVCALAWDQALLPDVSG